MNDKNPLSISEPFNFDLIMQMAQEAPEQLERLYKDEVEAVIAAASECRQGRLRGLQFRLDGASRAAKNPMDACVRAFSMMMDEGVGQLHMALTEPSKLKVSVDAPKAEVLEFKPKNGPE